MSQSKEFLTELGLAVVNELSDSLDRHSTNIREVQEALAQKLEILKAQISAIEENTNLVLEKNFTAEEERRQKVATKIREWLVKLENSDSLPPDEVRVIKGKVEKWTKRAQAELLVKKSYNLIEGSPFKMASLEKEEEKEQQQTAISEIDLTNLYKVSTTCSLSLEHVHMDTMNAVEVKITKIQDGRVFYKVENIFGPYGDKVIKERLCKLAFTYEFMLYEKDKEEEATAITKEDAEGYIDLESVKYDVTYCLKCKIILDGKESEWSKAAEFKGDFARCCRWKSCDPNYPPKRFYEVCKENPRIVTTSKGPKKCIATGNVALPANKVVKCGIRPLKTKLPLVNGVHIGVAPVDVVAQKIASPKKPIGWYLVYESMNLRSGPPHNYMDVKYGTRKVYKDFRYSGPTVCLIMDMTKGELSFIVDGINFGTAFEGIPLDKPLVPFVRFKWEDTYEIVPEISSDFEISPNLPVPSNIVASSREWESAILQWNPVPGALFYQVELNGSSLLMMTKKPSHELRGLFPDTEFSFRVRSVAKNRASVWSSVIKGKTNKVVHKFSECAWKKCRDMMGRGYVLKEENPRIGSVKERHSGCPFMGNTPIPLNEIVRWSVKLHRIGDSDDVIIGVIPTTFSPNKHGYFGPSHQKNGWFLNGRRLMLCSGPPHNYHMENYTNRNRRELRYDEGIREGDTVGVVMNTTKGELSFVLNGVNLGVAYEGIPLDKPLVPCVLLENKGDSVELIL